MTHLNRLDRTGGERNGTTMNAAASRPRARVLAEATKTLAFRAISVVVGGMSSLLLARTLSVGEMGAYSLFGLFAAVMGALFGSGYSGVAYLVSNRRIPAAAALRSALPIIAVGAASSITLALYLPAANAIGTSPIVAMLAGMGVAAFIAASYWQGIFLGLSRITAHNVTQYGPQYLLLILLITGALSGRLTFPWAVGAWAAAHILNVLRLAVTRGHADLAAKQGASWQLARVILRFNWQLAIGSVLTIAASRANLVTLTARHGLYAAALYSVPLLLAESLCHFPMSLVVASYGTLGELSRARSAEVTARFVRATLWALSLLAAVFAASAGLLPVLLGAKYAPAVKVLRILMLGIPAYACKDVFVSFFLNQDGRPGFAGATFVLGAVVSVVIGILIVPEMGAAGAAWAYVCAALVSFGVLAFRFSRSCRIPLKDLIIIRAADLSAIAHRQTGAASDGC